MKKLGIYILYAAAIYFPVFLHLERRTIRLWDEALFALRSLYLNENGELLVNFNQFDQLPDHINTKPIFGTLFQSLSFEIFGYNELGLRLPIALFILFTIGTMIWFSKYFLKKIEIGLVAGLILVSSSGFMMVHVGRGGEQDAILAALMFLSMISFYIYSSDIRAPNSSKYLVLCSAAVVAGILTKLVVGCFFLAGFVLYLIHRGMLKTVLTDRRIYYNIFGALIALSVYVFVIVQISPGYIQRLWDYEITGRFNQVIETDSLAWNYYIRRLFDGKFLPWIAFAIIPFFWLRRTWFGKNQAYLWLSFYCVLVYLTTISFSQTKKFWYDAPVYPVLSMLAAVGLFKFYDFLKSKRFLESQFQKLVFSILMILIFVFPYAAVIQKVYLPKNGYKADKYGYLIRTIENKNPELKEITIAISDWGASAVFYQQAYNIQKAYNFKVTRSIEFHSGEYVLACMNNVLNPIFEKYNFEDVYNYEECKLIKITGIKNLNNGD